MTAEAFLDTNVFVYAFDSSNSAKQKHARSLIGRNDWFTSWQVVQEFANVALHRFEVPMNAKDLKEYMDLILWPHCRILPSLAIHEKALEIHEKLQYRYADSLIVASALAGEADILFSEDLQHGRKIGTLRIENPFL